MIKTTLTDRKDARSDMAAFAMLGDGKVAYVKAMLSDDVRRLFPDAPNLAAGLDLYALLGADGTPIMLTDNRDIAIGNALAQDLKPVSLH
jgi:hypothetical protein